MTVKICVAVVRTGGFAKDRQIPWNIPEDFKHFMNTTKGTACITGRHSYEEMVEMKKAKMGKKYNPNNPVLAKRDTFVVSSTLKDLTDATVIDNISTQIHKLSDAGKDVFLLGGEKVFSEGIVWVDEIIMTVIPEYYDCDRFFPIDYLQKYFRIAEGHTLDTKNHGELFVVKYIRVLRG